MSITCEQIRAQASGLPLVRACDLVRSGAVRLSTPFVYPNGAHLDVFVEGASDLIDQVRVSDKGETTAYLLDLHIKPWATSRRERMIAAMCEPLGVVVRGGELCLTVAADHLATELAPAIARLAQACIRVAGLQYSHRLRGGGSFREDFEEFALASGIVLDTGPALVGRFGREVRVDFRAQGRKSQSLVVTLSAANAAAAHTIANEAFRKWFDLDDHRGTLQFLSIYDSDTDAFREDDLQRLNTLSTVFSFPAELEALSEFLA